MERLAIDGLTWQAEGESALQFWGEVINLEQTTHRWVRITIRLLDAARNVLAEKSDITGLEWTLPSGKNPFFVRFENPPRDWHSYDVTVASHVHDYADAGVPQPHAGLQVDRVHYREINRAGLYASLIGLLNNTSDTPASHVKVAATLYGPDGRVVGVLSPYMVPQGVLAPGDSMHFELKFYALSGPVADYTVQAQGRKVAT
jgi:hypothetical protein